MFNQGGRKKAWGCLILLFWSLLTLLDKLKNNQSPNKSVLCPRLISCFSWVGVARNGSINI